MNVRFVRLVGRSGVDLPDAPPGFLDDLRFLRERRGEKIAAVDADSGALLGSVAVHPDRDVGGTFYRLSAIEVSPGRREQGIEDALLREVEKLLRANRACRLKLGTSPLVTANAALYITRFGARYRWRPGARTPDGRPWPHVSCECDFDDPLARPLDLRDEEVEARSVLVWNEGRPARPRHVVYAGPLSVLMPDLTGETVRHAAAADRSFLPTLYDTFHDLFRHGYGFAWFDRLPGAALWYYVMSPQLGF